ncbi:hypothetical protein BDK92_5038 [Micromonospora pisi]|uniref:Flavin reductase (DIM6/NTAB) family NADH-FMN oxidoreductase RutF n=1 Tax=Micromonospora pisi TaxID=589240 RepID=A0A495JNM0_9ACTN|nr:hypothetical protein [Micromonospora pisi]RKR90660.1 hypothetical protein BDK92_5038 [Micromonospora pisi]
MDEDDLSVPHRPDTGWLCADCARPWPCPIFRGRLRILYHRESDKLVTFMEHFRERAAEELTDLSPAEIEARFLGWISDPPPRRRLRSI